MQPPRPLTAAELLGARPRIEAVDLTDLDPALGVVHVRGLTARDRDAWETEQFQLQKVPGKAGLTDVARALVNLRARLVARTACNPDGSRLFTDAQAAQLGDVRADVLDRLYAVAQRLSGFSKRDEAELLGEAAGERSGDASPSASPASSATEASTDPAGSSTV